MRLSIRDAACFFGIDEETVRNWIEERGLPAARVNGQTRLSRDEILEWATVTGTPVVRDPLADAATHSDACSGIAEALAAGGVFHGVPGADKESVLASVVRMLKLPERLDRDFLLQVLLAREALGSTGVGGGIAIPHPRNPIVLNVDRPSASLALLETPVDFAAPDGQPVSALFVLISATVRMHLHLLSRLSRVLHDPLFKRVLSQRGTEAEILASARQAEAAIPGAGK